MNYSEKDFKSHNIFLKKNIDKFIKELIKEYPNAKSSLNFNSGFELGICLILAAQCTDERVNKITQILFKKYPDIKNFLNADIKDIEKIIYSCGFYKNKSKYIIDYAHTLYYDFNNILPDSIDKLMMLPGIGRKSANILLLEEYNAPVGIAVDTHVKRLSRRIGFSQNTFPDKVEQDLIKIIPSSYFKNVNHLFVLHGRAICSSRSPKCDVCPTKDFCLYYKNTIDKT